MAPDGGANSIIADLFTRHALDLLRVEAGQRKAIRELLTELEADLVAQLARVDPTGPARESYRVQRLEKLLAQVKDTITASYRGASSALRGELMELAEIEAEFAANALNEGAQMELATASLTRSQAKALVGSVLVQGAPVADWWERQAGDTLQRFTDAMRLGIAQGDTNAQLIQRIRGGTRNGEPVLGFMDISRRNADSLVRSATQAIAEAAKDTTYEANADILAAVVWTSTLDSRTTVLCQVRDGLRYTVKGKKPIGHDVPWLAGPGNLHFGAVTRGTLITTRRGSIPVEDVTVGDAVLTHTGQWSVVTEAKRKAVQGGVVRVAHLQSGRILRATDDHPILAGGHWTLMGDLQIGDDLCSNPDDVKEEVRACRLIASEPEYGPTCVDEGSVSFRRAIKLVATNIGLECAEDVRAGEVEDRAIKVILADPSVIYRDQSFKHHTFALARMLAKEGRYGLGNLLAMVAADGFAFMQRADFVAKPVRSLRRKCAGGNVWVAARVVLAHAFGMARIHGMSFFGQPKPPMVDAGWVNNATARMVKSSLIGLGPNRDGVAARISGQATVCQPFGSFDAAKGYPVADMAVNDKHFVQRVKFGQDRVLSLKVQTYNDYVYDLEVQGQSSYFANGVAVSNCRSASRPETKSWRELGIDIDDLPPSTRASMDGQIAADTTFEGWLTKRTKEQQDEALGVGRADLWRTGKISFRDLLDANGRTLTLAELRARI